MCLFTFDSFKSDSETALSVMVTLEKEQVAL